MKRGKIDVRKSLRASFKDGVFASVMTGVMDNYVIPFALRLGATEQQVGVVGGFPSLIGSLSQLFAAHAVHLIGGRLRLLVRAVSAQASVLLAIAFLALIDIPCRVETLVFLLALFFASGAMAGPAWGSLMTDYVPKPKWGSYFGWRNRMLGLVNVASMMAVGFLLYWTRANRLTLVG